MSHLTTILKSCLTALLMTSISLSASAELKRYPERAPVTQKASDPAAAARFLKAYSKRAESRNTVTPAPTTFDIKQTVKRGKNPLKSPSSPVGATLALVPSHSQSASYSDAYIGSLDPSTGELTRLFSGIQFSNAENYYYEAAVIRDNLLYIPVYTQDMVTAEIVITWKVIDMTTGEQVDTIYFGSDVSAYDAFCYSLTYDPDKDLFYGLTLDVTTGMGSRIVKIDPKEAKWHAESVLEFSGAQGDALCCIAYNPIDQQIYGLKDSLTLVMIDLAEDFPDIIEMHQYDDFEEYFMQPDWAQSNGFCFSPYDKAFLFVYRNSAEERMMLISIDADTYEAYEVADITPLGYISALISTDSYAQDAAPDRMAAPVLNFDKASLTGTYTATAPVKTFAGLDIAGPMKMHLLVDGAEFESFDINPGQTVTRGLTLTQGKHEIEIYCSLPDGDGPKTSVKIYAGNDKPQAPSDLKIDGNVITWTAPGELGVNKGYVDTKALTYDIYFNGVKQNMQPLTECKFRFAAAEQMERKSITVTATANGMTSDFSTPLSRTIGEALSLPFVSQPATAEEATLFETYSVPDNEEHSFRFTSLTDKEGNGYNAFAELVYYPNRANDWLFLPALDIEKGNGIYELAFDYANAWFNNKHLDNLDIYLGTAPEPGKMQNLIYTHTDRNTPDREEVKVRFSVKEAGEYVIGFHSRPGNAYSYRGVQLSNFRVNASDGSSKAPGSATDVTLTADKDGELYLNIAFKAPAKDLLGNDIDADTDVTVTARTEVESKSTTLRPGAEGSIRIAVADSGFSNVILSTSSTEGEGAIDYYRAYAGLDVPLPPRNVKGVIDNDNCGIMITWEAPEGGANGGYIDTEALRYDIMTQASAGMSSKVGTADGLSYHFTINPAEQTTYHVGPVAINEMGTSIGAQFIYESLGTPYPTPVVEEWGNAAFSYQKWYFSNDGEYAASQVTSIPNAYGLGLNDPELGVGGAFLISNMGAGSTRYRIFAPKVDTSDLSSATVSVRAWDYPNAGTVEFWGRTAADQEFRLIKTHEMPHSRGTWMDLETPLPDEFCGQPWIQINVLGTLENGQQVLLDNYSVKQNIDYDFSVISLDGPSISMIGDKPTFHVELANAGAEPGTSKFIFEIMSGDDVLMSEEIKVGNTSSGKTFERNIPVEMIADWQGKTDIRVRARITDELDGNPNNNERSIDLLLMDHQLPVINTLKAARDGQDVVLDWETPDTSYGSPEGFEVTKAFEHTENLGLWKNFDLDGATPYVIDAAQFRFDGDNLPAGWITWDAQEMKSMEEERLSPHSGNKFILARSTGETDEETHKGVKAFDWLISPEIVPGTPVSFWYNTLQNSYTETVELWVSYSDDVLDPDNIEYDNSGNPKKCGSFVWKQNFTKYGADAWEQCEISAKAMEGVKYFALVYGSWNQFGAMLDDIVFTPREKYNWQIKAYEVISSINSGNPAVVGKNITQNSFREANDALSTTYWVRAVVESNGTEYRSPYSNAVTIEGSKVNGIDNAGYVAGGKECVVIGNHAGETAEIFDAEGRMLRAVTLTSNRQAVTVSAGPVIVKVADRYHKVMVR